MQDAFSQLQELPITHRRDDRRAIGQEAQPTRSLRHFADKRAVAARVERIDLARKDVGNPQEIVAPARCFQKKEISGEWNCLALSHRPFLKNRAHRECTRDRLGDYLAKVWSGTDVFSPRCGKLT